MEETSRVQSTCLPALVRGVQGGLVTRGGENLAFGSHWNHLGSIYRCQVQPAAEILISLVWGEIWALGF